MTKPVVVCANMRNEKPRVEQWFDCFTKIADGGMLIVDTFSTDGTFEFFQERNIPIIQSRIIQEEGYGAARTNLRELSIQYFPNAHWCAFFDADELLDESEFHTFRWIKDYLSEDYDVIAFPRIDWCDYEKIKAENDIRISADWQARMSRLDSPIRYIRKLHEQITGHNQIFANLQTPKINHFHRSTKEKRVEIGKLCSKLHMEDSEFGSSYPEHPKEQYYRNLYLTEGL